MTYGWCEVGSHDHPVDGLIQTLEADWTDPYGVWVTQCMEHAL